MALSQDFSYEQSFKSGLSSSSYNILLNDYAYFQFGRVDNTSWRLGFFPNPWLTGMVAAEFERRHWETLEEIGLSITRRLVTLLLICLWWLQSLQ